MLLAGSIVGALYNKLQTQSSAPEDGRNYRLKHVELIEITNKLLLLHLVGCLYYVSVMHGHTNIKYPNLATSHTEQAFDFHPCCDFNRPKADK